MKGIIKIITPEGDGPVAGTGTKVVIADTGVELPMITGIQVNIPCDDAIKATLSVFVVTDDITAQIDKDRFVSELEIALSIYADAMGITFAELQRAIGRRHTAERG